MTEAELAAANEAAEESRLHAINLDIAEQLVIHSASALGLSGVEPTPQAIADTLFYSLNLTTMRAPPSDQLAILNHMKSNAIRALRIVTERTTLVDVNGRPIPKRL